MQLEGLDYLPFVFESFGGLSMDTESFISKLATSTSISHRFGDSRHVVKLGACGRHIYFLYLMVLFFLQLLGLPQ